MDNMDKYIGQTMDGRYEIVEKIGEGGMSVVYKALDHRLNRFVALKVLKDELALDEDFLRRFHTESQAVAMLSHPNIVAVYDVSRSSEVEYIVMELIEGITLKQYMLRRGKLTWKEVLHFSAQIAKALSHAHSRGIIHRDIKPHNILILADSSVKVTDFGIARLTNLQDTLTNETLGSVHYISPEQAKGGHIDARTDLYSLGVVMYEMLTGRLPFEGDSAVAVAIQHISSIPLMPREIDPEIPAGLEAITMKAMNPDLNARYQSADEIYDDLEAFRKDPEMNFDYSEKEIIEAVNPPAPYEPELPERKGRDRGVTPVSRRGDMSREDYIRSRQRARRVSTLSGIFLVLLAILALFYFIWTYWLRDMFTTPETMSVPGLIGSRLDDVMLNRGYTDHFNIIPEYETNDLVSEGTIFGQSPAEGRTVIKSDKKVDLMVTVSSGSNTLVMPGVLNTEYRQAFLSLRRLGLEVEVETVTSDMVTEGYIISTSPNAGAELREGDTVTIVVSGGPELQYAPMPDLLGRSSTNAQAILEGLNLTLGNIIGEDNDAPAGTVIRQSIQPNEEIPQHTKVDLTISNGPLPEPEEPEEPEPTEPEQGEEPQPTEPEQGGETQPTEPEQGGETTPTEPEQGEEPQPTEPEQGGETTPAEPEPTEPEEPVEPPEPEPVEPTEPEPEDPFLDNGEGENEGGNG